MTESRFPDAPPRIRRLPVESRGFPVPWFLAWGGVGEPDFRFVHPARVSQAIRGNLCWICGGKLGRLKTFTIGPMCAVNRVSSEPPSHPECATFAAQACPFLSRPLAKRIPIPEELKKHSVTPGFMIERNPGVTLIWSCLRYRLIAAPAGTREGTLFQIGQPTRAEWYASGRPATREEVLESIETGLPDLLRVAAIDGQEAIDELAEATAVALQLLPKAA